jgi:hypothetical protein
LEEKKIGPPLLTLEAMKASLASYLTGELGVDAEDEDERAGVAVMADACLSYFRDGTSGAPKGAAGLMLWVVFSAIWQGTERQEDIDAFFSAVDLDPRRIMRAWMALGPEERKGPFSMVLVPGRLDEADISDVAAALYHARPGAN